MMTATPGLAHASTAELLAMVQRTLCLALSRGASRAGAAAAVGISEATLAGWLARASSDDPARPPSPELRAFAVAVHQAEAAFELATVEALNRAAAGGPGDARALQWLLERRFPERWGPGAAKASDASDASGDDLANIDLRSLTDEELEHVRKTGKLPRHHSGVIILPPLDPEGTAPDSRGPAIFLPPEDPET